MCCIVSNTKIFYFNPKTQHHSFIEFDKSFGKLACFEWFDDESLFVCFLSGQCTLISTKPQTMGKSLSEMRPFLNAIEGLAVNHETKKVAVCS